MSQGQRDELNKVKKYGKHGYWLNGKLHIESTRPGSAATERGQQIGNSEGYVTDRPWRFGENRGRGFTRSIDLFNLTCSDFNCCNLNSILIRAYAALDFLVIFLYIFDLNFALYNIRK